MNANKPVRSKGPRHKDMHHIIQHGTISTLQWYLDHGERPCLTEGSTCFPVAKEWDKVKLLLKYEPKGSNIADCNGFTLVHKFGHDLTKLQFLIDCGAKDTSLMLNKCNGLIDWHLRDKFKDVKVGSMSFLIGKTSQCGGDIESLVDMLVGSGFRMVDGRLSPLTTFVLSKCRTFGKGCNYVDFLINKGAQVEQQVLVLQDKELQSIKEYLCLPDALLVAVLKGDTAMITQLVHYWGYPPLYLLLFCPQKMYHDLVHLLSGYGGIPQGTVAYQQISLLLGTGHRHGHDIFMKIHRSPLSLREICRYHIRASLSPGLSLPDKVCSISPPGLKSFLLMQTNT